MANHFSALKRTRQTEKKTAVNRANMSRLRTQLRKLKTAVASGDQSQTTAVYNETVSLIDKSVKKGVIHKNTGSRYKSRLSVRVKKATAAK
jgi:small subunit ribosomal protein S20